MILFNPLIYRTSEARLQVALAEIPYLNNRLKVDYEVELNQKHSPTRKGETYFQERRMILNKLQSKINAKIDALRGNRMRLRESRRRLDIPTVAVIGTIKHI